MLQHHVLAVMLALASLPLQAASYTIDPRHTQGVLSWNHLGFSNPTAQFSLVQGALQFDPANPAASTVRATIALTHLHTGVPELDDYLRDPVFFDVAQFPTVTFKSSKVETAGAPNRLKVGGDLTVRGVTKPVMLEVTVNKIGSDPRYSELTMAGFEATAVLKRSDFGMGKYVDLVSDEIRIRITCQAIESNAYAKHLQADAARAVKDAAEKALLAKNAAADAEDAEKDAAQQAAFAKYAAENTGMAGQAAENTSATMDGMEKKQ